MKETEEIILLLFCVAFLSLVSRKYKISFPIVLVLAGLIVSVNPALPSLALRSDVVFPLFLPLLLFYTAWNISWFTFKRHLRTILLASFSLVFFSVFAIGAVVYFLMPALGWPLSLLVGAILSPPDAVCATSITKGLGLHPRLITILEGESLLNDASALIAYKFALSFVVTGSFQLSNAGTAMLLNVIGGCSVGLLLGYLLNRLHLRFTREPILSITMMLLAPFLAYLLAERLHFSGVIAVVITGLYLSYRSDKLLTAETRISGYAVWEVVTFILNSLVFILIGFQLKNILRNFSFAYTSQLLLYSLLIVLACLVIRFLWTVPNTLLPRVLSRKIREQEPFEKKNILVFAWAGMKGFVSMAIALSLPENLPNHQPFPYRSEIIFITFFVILFTLLFQGLTLPLIVKKLRLPKYSVLAEEYEVRTYLKQQVHQHIHSGDETLAPDIRSRLLQKYTVRHTHFQTTRMPYSQQKDPATAAFNDFAKAELRVLEMERSFHYRLRKEGKATEEVLHKIERELDLEEQRIRMTLYNG